MTGRGRNTSVRRCADGGWTRVYVPGGRGSLNVPSAADVKRVTSRPAPSSTTTVALIALGGQWLATDATAQLGDANVRPTIPWPGVGPLVWPAGWPAPHESSSAQRMASA